MTYRTFGYTLVALTGDAIMPFLLTVFRDIIECASEKEGVKVEAYVIGT